MMDARIRVKTSSKHQRLYSELKKLFVEDAHEFFFICACIGYRNQIREPLGSEAEERFWSGTITPEESACYYAMILESHEFDFEILRDDASILNEIQEYANAGIQLLVDDILVDYLSNKSDKVPALDPTTLVELPRTLLNYLYDISVKSQST